jgi:hypothetical protein
LVGIEDSGGLCDEPVAFPDEQQPARPAVIPENSLVIAFVEQLVQAPTKERLTELTKQIVALKFEKHEQQRLNAAYKARKRELQP